MMNKKETYYYIFCGTNDFIEDKKLHKLLNTSPECMLRIKYNTKIGRLIRKRV